MSGKIHLDGVRIFAYHGVSKQEQLVGNHYEINLTVEYPIERAMISDDLNDTLSYAALFEVIKNQMAIPSQLLEHVIGRIATELRQQYPLITSISLKISKLTPPIDGEIRSASVSIDL